MRAACLLVLLSATVCSPQTRDRTMETYANARFGYAVDYPSDLLVPQGEAENGDGQAFESKDKSIRLRVWGINNALEKTVEGECAQRIEWERNERKLNVTYKVIRKTWFAFSGVAGKTIVYERAVLDDEAFKFLQLEYPATRKDELDPLVGRIIASFRLSK